MNQKSKKKNKFQWFKNAFTRKVPKIMAIESSWEKKQNKTKTKEKEISGLKSIGFQFVGMNQKGILLCCCCCWCFCCCCCCYLFLVRFTFLMCECVCVRAFTSAYVFMLFWKGKNVRSNKNCLPTNASSELIRHCSLITYQIENNKHMCAHVYMCVCAGRCSIKADNRDLLCFIIHDCACAACWVYKGLFFVHFSRSFHSIFSVLRVRLNGFRESFTFRVERSSSSSREKTHLFNNKCYPTNTYTIWNQSASPFWI